MKTDKIKCVIWDLDNTLWQGTLLEDPNVILRPGIEDVIKTLDKRGVLQSIASRSEFDVTESKLKLFGLAEYFLYPQIKWQDKSISVKIIADSLNIGIDTVCFIDDDPFERDEVFFALPDVLCLDSTEIPGLLDMPRLIPEHITTDSAHRREMVRNDMIRTRAETEFSGTRMEFLASLDMEMTIFPAGKDDLPRAHELTVRTNQLNATGYVYSFEELTGFLQSENHLLLMAGLTDKYGSYGRIGLALVELGDRIWTLKLLLMSCRVISRGVGSVFLNYIRQKATLHGVRLLAEFIPTGSNRVMEITYRLSGFQQLKTVSNGFLFESPLESIPPCPDYIRMIFHE
ncbi:HAD-IIIC family phosphatase [candidate division KSB1 bacterium]|nr:HAD-IIIC family phosphatase [candidate division KSB1 bacterium]